jgi:hypothetical protein
MTPELILWYGYFGVFGVFAIALALTRPRKPRCLVCEHPKPKPGPCGHCGADAKRWV